MFNVSARKHRRLLFPVGLFFHQKNVKLFYETTAEEEEKRI